MKECRIVQPHGWAEPGMARLIVIAQGYAMVRRPGCAPFLMSKRDWLASPRCDKNGNLIQHKGAGQ